MTTATNKIMQGVEVDELNQPLKMYSLPFNPATASGFDKGAHAAYHGLSRRTQRHSEEWRKGYQAQCKNLPRKSEANHAVAWSRCLYRKGGIGWHMGDNW